MLFNSLQFLIFFTAIVFIYYIIPHRLRWFILLSASYFFYACWNMDHVICLAASTVVTYYGALRMHAGQKKKMYLSLSFITNMGMLIFFKYVNLFSGMINPFLKEFSIVQSSPFFKVMVPIGLAFYTLKSIGYSIDVYRGAIEPEKHFGIFALYVSFFPQIISGPIDRAQWLLPQLYERKTFDPESLKNGIMLMLWGYYKKIAVADRLAPVVNGVYDNPMHYNGVHFSVATALFAVQLYCDFSGYTDIARGAALAMGIRLSDNFNRPYLSRSIVEFWRRWHISLSTWFRDYLYISLGGNRVVRWRWYLNLFITFVIAGLWHGGQWTFIVWGCLHGAFIIISRVTEEARKKVAAAVYLDRIPSAQRIFQITITVLLVCFGWIFFRSRTMPEALHIINMLPVGWGTINQAGGLAAVMNALNLDMIDAMLMAISIAIVLLIHRAEKHENMDHMFENRPLALRWLLYYVIIFGILLMGNLNQNTFIYFRF